jgi:hypothetical protein
MEEFLQYNFSGLLYPEVRKVSTLLLIILATSASIWYSFSALNIDQLMQHTGSAGIIKKQGKTFLNTEWELILSISSGTSKVHTSMHTPMCTLCTYTNTYTHK